MTKICCVIMASGVSARFNGNKLLTELHGKRLIEYILDTTSSLPFCKVLTVTRHPEVEAICQARLVACLLHKEPLQSDTVRLGVTRLEQQVSDCDGILFCTADQPFIKAETILRICQAFQEAPNYIYRTSWQGTPGNPILFPSRFFAALKQLPPDKGGSVICKAHPEQVRYVEVEAARELYDIDTVEDLQKIQ